MRLSKLIYRNLVHFRRTHAGLVFGSMMATAVLVGALIVGDSMRHSLRQMSLRRLGKTVYAITSGDFFAASMAMRLEEDLGVPVAPVLHIQGLARKSGGQIQVNPVQIYGITDDFPQFAHESFQIAALKSDEVLINTVLAEKLNVKAGETFLLRFEKDAAIPGDMPLSTRESQSAVMRLTVRDILTSQQLGHFSLRISQIPPASLFLPLTAINEILDQNGKVNVLLIGNTPTQSRTQGEIVSAFKKIWLPSDAGLSFLIRPKRRMIELVSDRIFMDKNITDPALHIGESGSGILTYFANRIKSDQGVTPYSFISTIDGHDLPDSMTDQDIIVSPWLAEDLTLSSGDSVTVSYYIVNETSDLIESSTRFYVHSVLPSSSPFLSSSLMPDIPGLSDSENCRDWDPGIPIDLNLIRPKDEDYWATFKGTPKALISLSAGKKIWANRFGHLTAIQYPQSVNTLDLLQSELQIRLDPFKLGFQLTSVRDEALQAGDQGVDFGQLFLGLSFFIIASALMLLGLFFVFAIEQRQEEIGLLAAIGFQRTQIRNLLILEGGVLALIGTGLGIGGGLLFTKLTLNLLGT
ncbi:FtsX-like permease family protein, partial [bacterium]